MVRFVQLRSLASLVLQLAILGVLIAAFFIRFCASLRSLDGAADEFGRICRHQHARVSPPYTARGDIVTFRHDGATPGLYIKRVIGLPGDRIRIERGVVYVNGVRLNEPYVQFPDDRSEAGEHRAAR